MDNMNQTPSSSRLHIALFGRRNAGKSSLLNALTHQQAALVSTEPGTTTDPVSKAMELLPLGPVVFIDTAGLDDRGSLGEMRVEKSYEVLNHTDLAVLVLDGPTGLSDFDIHLLEKVRFKGIPVVGVINKQDIVDDLPEKRREWEAKLGLELIEVSAVSGQGLDALKMALVHNASVDDLKQVLTGDLLRPGDLAVLVVPIDKAAPKGRLILPQQQVIRDILDHNALALVTKETELQAALNFLDKKPALVITDSQAFAMAAAHTPREIPLTSFSILLARQKGDLQQLVRGALAIKELRPGDRVLIAEGCTHHRQSDDIGTVKIPRWLRQTVGGELEFEWTSGLTLPQDLHRYRMVVHCGGCMLNRREMLYRLSLAREQGVPMVNYGVLIAYVQGILPRVLEPFPEVREIIGE